MISAALGDRSQKAGVGWKKGGLTLHGIPELSSPPTHFILIFRHDMQAIDRRGDRSLCRFRDGPGFGFEAACSILTGSVDPPSIVG